VTVEHPKFPANDFKWFMSICAMLVGLAGTLIFIFGVSIVPALMLAAPVMTCFWIWLQNRRVENGTALTQERCKQLVMETLPSVSPEAVTLSVAGYIGMVAGGLLPAEKFADALGLTEMSPILIYIAVAAIMPLASCIAMPPMMIATFLAAILTSCPEAFSDMLLKNGPR